MGEFIYVEENEIKSGEYFFMHHELIRNSFYRSKLSNHSIILYGLLRDRLSLSKLNNIRDTSGRLYVLASAAAIMKALDVGKNTVTKIFKELTEVGLIKFEKMPGYNNKRRIYIGELKKQDNPQKNNTEVCDKKQSNEVTIFKNTSHKNKANDSMNNGNLYSQKQSRNKNNFNNNKFNNKATNKSYFKEYDFGGIYD